MIVYEIEITGKRGFYRVTAAFSLKDAQNIERYWKSRGYRVMVDSYVLQHSNYESDILNSKVNPYQHGRR